jgi:YcaO-like protein with predicted kinase domain
MERLDQRSNLAFMQSEGRELSTAQSMKRARDVADQIGLTRIAEIGRFLDPGIFVCQSSRPQLLHHYSQGLNTGSQGKGYSFQQAYISTVMEAAEAFCGEPRTPKFIRASYKELRKTHFVANPNSFVFDLNEHTKIEADEPVLWTMAFHVGMKREVLIPAGLVYVFVDSNDYGCRMAHSQSSTGLAAGFDIFSASCKAIFEIIERHYTAQFDAGDALVEGFVEDETIASCIQHTSTAFRQRADTFFYAGTVKDFYQPFPFIKCIMRGPGGLYCGYGSGLDPLSALQAAHLEAFQVWATWVSGAREDLARERQEGALAEQKESSENLEKVWPDEMTLSFVTFARRFQSLQKLTAMSPNQRLWSLAKVLNKSGYPDVYLVNLSRNGVDCSVVRAVIPGLRDFISLPIRPKKLPRAERVPGFL